MGITRSGWIQSYRESCPFVICEKAMVAPRNPPQYLLCSRLFFLLRASGRLTEYSQPRNLYYA